jgi:hypothetical protein
MFFCVWYVMQSELYTKYTNLVYERDKVFKQYEMKGELVKEEETDSNPWIEDEECEGKLLTTLNYKEATGSPQDCQKVCYTLSKALIDDTEVTAECCNFHEV